MNYCTSSRFVWYLNKKYVLQLVLTPLICYHSWYVESLWWDMWCHILIKKTEGCFCVSMYENVVHGNTLILQLAQSLLSSIYMPEPVKDTSQVGVSSMFFIAQIVRRMILLRLWWHQMQQNVIWQNMTSSSQTPHNEWGFLLLTNGIGTPFIYYALQCTSQWFMLHKVASWMVNGTQPRTFHN